MSDNQARVLQVTWNWRAAVTPNDDPAPALRRAAVIQAVVMGAVAATLILGWHHILAGRIVAGLAVVILFLGLGLPGAYRPIHHFGQLLGRVVGTVLVHVLLVPFFYLFFFPAAVLLRLMGRDPLHRKFKDRQWTYWIERAAHPRGYNISKQYLHEDHSDYGALHEVGSLPRRRTPEA